MTKLFLFLLAVSAVSIANADTPDDPGCARDGVSDRPSQENPSFYYKNESPYVACDKDNLGYQMRRAYQFLVDILDNFDGESRYSRDILDFSPVAFLNDNVEMIKVNGIRVPECETNAGFVLTKEPKTIYVCVSAKDHTPLWHAGLLVHEARHANGFATGLAGFPHDICTNPFSKGSAPKYACDPNVENAGAWTAEFELFVGVSHLQQLSVSLRDEARASALPNLFQMYNELSGFTEGAAILRKSGKLDFWGGGKILTLLQDVPTNFSLEHEQGTIKFRNARAVNPSQYLFDGRVAKFDPNSVADHPIIDHAIFRKMGVCLRVDGVGAYDIATDDMKIWTLPKKTFPDTLIVFDNKWIHPDAPSEEHAYARFTNGRAIEIQSTYEEFKASDGYLDPSPEMSEMLAKYRFLGPTPIKSPFPNQLMALEAKTGHLQIMPKGVLLPNPGDDVQTMQSTVVAPVKQMNSPVFWDEALGVL